MTSRRDFTGLLVALATAPIVRSGTPRPDDAPLFVVYLRLFGQQSKRPTTVVVESERTDASDQMHGFKSWHDVQRTLPEVSRAAAIDLLSNPKLAKPVFIPLNAPGPSIRVIQPLASDIQRVFESDGEKLDDQWKSFSKRFEGATSIVNFSNVGYNATFDEAVFVAGVLCGALCGSGTLVQMRRTGKGWVVAKTAGMWIS